MRREWTLRCEAVAWVDLAWPGWIKVRLDDADGWSWFLVDKLPVFGLDTELGTRMPLPLDLPCDAVSNDGDHVVVELRGHVQAHDGTNRFRVRRQQLTAAGTP